MKLNSNFINLNNNVKKLKKLFYYKSDIGSVRRKNEDFAYSGTNSLLDNLVIVCDGLGSYPGSEKASEIVSKVFIESFLKHEYSLSSKETWFKNCIKKAKLLMREHVMQFHDHLQMSTTLVLALIIKDDVHLFWIGDSRAYLITKKECEQITDDHNLLNHLLSIDTPEEEIKKYGDALLAITNCITINIDDEQKYGYLDLKLKKNTFIFLASDGFYNFYDLNNIYDVISYDSNNAENIANELINTAITNQSNDNISFAYFGYIKE